jgi:hypothetical protein
LPKIKSPATEPKKDPIIELKTFFCIRKKFKQ